MYSLKHFVQTHSDDRKKLLLNDPKEMSAINGCIQIWKLFIRYMIRKYIWTYSPDFLMNPHFLLIDLFNRIFTKTHINTQIYHHSTWSTTSIEPTNNTFVIVRSGSATKKWQPCLNIYNRHTNKKYDFYGQT